MLPGVRVPIANVLSTFDSGMAIDSTLAVLFAQRGGYWAHVPMADKTWGLFSAAVANGGSGILATITAGKYPVFQTIVVAGSVAGRYQLVATGMSNLELKLQANVSLVINFPPFGLFVPTAGVTLYLYNQSGAASDLSGAVLYSEVVA